MAIIVSAYNNSVLKKVSNTSFTTLSIVVLSPLFLLIFLLLKLINHGPVFFIQERTGKSGRSFKMIKFRTMIERAHPKQHKFKKQNEADGPVFKIYNDPRFTKFGKILAHTGLDELPQLVNVMRGEMSLVGPRPLPIVEAMAIPLRYRQVRELIRPGLTSSWVVNGSHKLSFKKWMELDCEYVKKANLTTDLSIIFGTFFIVLRSVGQKFTTRA